MGNESGSTLNQKVKAYADNLVGQPVVGNGECYDLADSALRKSGAKSAPDFGKITDTANYVWGRKVSDLTLVEPGDVLQFRDHEVTVRVDKKTKETEPNGSWKERSEFSMQTYKRGHHTAIVSSVDGDGTMTVIEQHVKDPATGRLSTVVRNNKLYVSNSRVTKPEAIYRGRTRIEVETTTTISVKGTIWAYRPQQ